MFLLCMEKIFSCFLSIENVHHFSKIFQLLPVLFSCAVSDFLHPEFSAKPIRAKITVMLYFIQTVLLILFVLLRTNVNDKSKTLSYRARLAQLVEHQTFNLRAMGSSPISGSNGILYVCTFYGNNFFLFMAIENVHHFANIYQLLPVLFSCAVSDFLYEEFSAKPIRAKITLMPFSMRMFLLILFVLLRININDKSKMLC